MYTLHKPPQTFGGKHRSISHIINRVNFLANQIARFRFSGEAILCDIERCFPAKSLWGLVEGVHRMARLITRLLSSLVD